MATNEDEHPADAIAEYTSVPSRDNGGFPFGIALTTEHVEPRKELATELGDLNQAYEHFRVLMDRTERMIIDTWTRTQAKQRQAMLTRFCEAIGLHKTLFNAERPDLDAFFMEDADRKSFKQNQLEDAACMPMLSAKLWKGTNLVELLTSRSRNHPHVFFFRDLHRVELAIRYKLLAEKNTKVTEKHHWAMHPDEEGIKLNECYEFKQDYDSLEMPSRLEIAVDAAARVYGIQTRLLQHLKILAESILRMAFPGKSKEEIDQMMQANPMESEPRPAVSNPSRKQMKKIKSILPQHVLELESNLLYGVPHPPDYEWLYSQAKARASSSVDLLTSARTHPMDLYEQAQEVSKHSIFSSPIFKNRKKGKDPGFQLIKHDDEEWSFTYCLVFKKLLFPCFVWSEISTALADFLELQSRMKANPELNDSTESRHDIQYYEKFHKLFTMVKVGQRLMQQFYAACLPHAPEFAKFYMGSWQVSEAKGIEILEDTIRTQYNMMIELKPNALSNKLHAGLYRLTEIDQRPDWALKGGFAPVIDKVLPTYTSDTDRDKLTDSLVFIFDNLLELTNIEKALYADHEMFFGYHRALYWNKLETACKNLDFRLIPLKMMMDTIDDFTVANGEFENLAHADVDRSKNFAKAYKETLDAQAHADRIWNAFENKVTGRCRGIELKGALTATRMEQISGFGFWVPRAHIPRLSEQIPSPPTARQAKKPPRPETQAAEPSPAEPSSEATTSRKRPYDISDHAEGSSHKKQKSEGPTKKVKTKTRPAEASEETPEDQAEAAPAEQAQEPEPEPKLTVYLRQAYETSQTLFDHSVPLPGKIPWSKIRELMLEMGYAQEPSGGSGFSYTVATKQAKAAFTGGGAHIIMHRYHRPGMGGMVEKQVLKRIIKTLEDRCRLDADSFKKAGPSQRPGPDVEVEDDQDDQEGQKQ